VAVPVAWAAWLLRIPVVSHESDVTPGLANRLIAPLARKLLYTFPETGKYVKGDSEHVGTPVRAELLAGSRERGLALTGFAKDERLPTYLVTGGSQGAQRLNDALLAVLPGLVGHARVIHLTGKGKAIPFTHAHYKAFEYVQDELKDLFAVTDFVVSRAGANSLFEFLALRKPMLLVPLELGSRGDQVINAEAFARSGWAHVLREKDLTKETFGAALERLAVDGPAMVTREAEFDGRGVADRILTILASTVR
jgi:UDP-N-acetylglucosamine--N-acetylmuramyl-(pentapeptide) pyrophosphoryl-undecaprenol N-acetylglucosamine transferase